MRTTFSNTAIKIAAALLIAILASIISANRTDTGKDRNDTAAYASHYYCISSGKTVEQCRSEIGGTQYEFFYEQLVSFLTITIKFNSFYQIKLATAIATYSIILLAVALQSRNASLSLLILLLDFRFWEYGSNVLRHGFAAAFLAASVIFLSADRPKLSFLAKLLSISSHLSAAIAIYTPRTKYKQRTLLALLAVTTLFVATPEYWIPAILASNLFDYKINYYIRNSDGYNFSLPIHYAAAILTGLLIYRKSNSTRFIITSNYLIALFMASIILGYLDASYRMTSFMLPLLAVNIPDQINMIANKFKEKKLAEEIFIGIIGMVLSLIAYKNWDFFLAHLD